jgi:hypothetical protein
MQAGEMGDHDHDDYAALVCCAIHDEPFFAYFR